MPKSCPRCQRALPPSATRLCVYCGSPLVRGATDPGFRPAQKMLLEVSAGPAK